MSAIQNSLDRDLCHYTTVGWKVSFYGYHHPQNHDELVVQCGAPQLLYKIVYKPH